MRYLNSCFSVLICWLLCGSVVFAFSDSRVNPGSGLIETVETDWNGSDFDVRHVEDPGPGTGTETVLASGSDDELDPRIEIDPAKDTWVVYWRDSTTPQVLLRRFDYSAGTWGPERQLSDSATISTRPSVAVFGSDSWAGFEESQSGVISIVVGIVVDEADPIGSVSTVGSTTFSGSRDAQVHSEPGNLWATWVDSSTVVAWSEYDSATETWSSVSTESYASDSVGLARKRIRLTVLGN